MDFRERAVALFERRRDAWLAEDIDGYLACFAPDLVLQTPMGPPVSGHAEYERMVRGSYRAIRPVSFDFHQIATHEPMVLAEWTITLEVRKDGRRMTYRGMSVCELRDELISSWREYYDPAHLKPA